MSEVDASTEGTGNTPPRIDEHWVRARLNRLWPVHNASLAELLIVLRRQFDGDLDAMLILLLVGLGARPDNWPGVLMHGQEQVRPGRGINTQSLADISGIPRESVRRKLLFLEEKGWISRNDRGRWHVTEGAAQDLNESTQVSISYFVRIFEAAQIPE
jgi:hypothetical protein